MCSELRAKFRPKYATIRDAAADWLARLEGQTTPELWNEFEAWLNADPRHRAEFIRLRVVWNWADCLRRLRPSDGTINMDLLSFPNEDQERGRNVPSASKPRQQVLPVGAEHEESGQQRKIVLPPGARLAAIAEFILTRESYKRYVRPIIADMQDEYVECIARGDEWRAHWVAVRGHFLVVPGWIYALVSRAARRIFGA